MGTREVRRGGVRHGRSPVGRGRGGLLMVAHCRYVKRGAPRLPNRLLLSKPVTAIAFRFGLESTLSATPPGGLAGVPTTPDKKRRD